MTDDSADFVLEAKDLTAVVSDTRFPREESKFAARRLAHIIHLGVDFQHPNPFHVIPANVVKDSFMALRYRAELSSEYADRKEFRAVRDSIAPEFEEAMVNTRLHPPGAPGLD